MDSWEGKENTTTTVTFFFHGPVGYFTSSNQMSRCSISCSAIIYTLVCSYSQKIDLNDGSPCSVISRGRVLFVIL